MPIITNISVQTKNKTRCNLFLDGEFFCAVSLETVMLNRLKVGMEMDSEELEKIVFENQKKEALVKATDYISRNLKTKRQVKDYLMQKGYSEQVAYYCIDKLKEYDYINDQEYSKRYIESVSKGQGRRLTEYKLMMKGVKKQDISSAYSEVEIDDRENAKTVAQKYLKNKQIDKQTIAKAYRYLIGRGFSYDEATYALSSFKEND